MLGKLWSEDQLAAELTNGEEISNILEKEYSLVRIRGNAAFRYKGIRDAPPGEAGAYCLWLVRTGFIVLPSDGDLGVINTNLAGDDSADVETNWLYTEQFVIAGTGNGGTEAFGPFQVDGQNHGIITRTYDISVRRRLEKDDILMWVLSWSLFDNQGSAPSAPPVPTTYGYVHTLIRCLSYRTG